MASPDQQPLPERYRVPLRAALERDPELVDELAAICAGFDRAARDAFLEELIVRIELVARPAAAVLPALEAVAERDRGRGEAG